MKNLRIYGYILLTGLLGLSACKPSIVQPSTFTAGTCDFTRYIALGNSLTAGYADGGLYLEGQQNSYPSIIAAQLQQVGGGTFTQPLFDASQASGSGYQSLTGFSATGSPILTAVAATAVTGSATIPGLGTVPIFAKYTGSFDNYGVPGIKLNDYDNAAYGNGNPYFARLLPGTVGTLNTKYIDFVTASSYTFFTDWLGNNDALGFATSGGVGGGDALTDKTVFTTKYNASIATLIAKGAKGALASIPDVTTIPYFNTVTYGALLAGVQKSAPTVTALYISGLKATTTATLEVRAATAADLFILTFPTALLGSTTAGLNNGAPYGLSPLNPIDSKYVLDGVEVAMVKDYVNSYNGTIRSAALANRLAYFDAFTFLNGVKTNGLLVNGVSLNANYISGGIFSLDGVHLTPRGYALVANEFIKSINLNYSANVPLADVSAYRGVKFP